MPTGHWPHQCCLWTPRFAVDYTSLHPGTATFLLFLAARAVDLRRAAADAAVLLVSTVDLRFAAVDAPALLGELMEALARGFPCRIGLLATLLHSRALSSAVLPRTQLGHGHSSADCKSLRGAENASAGAEKWAALRIIVDEYLHDETTVVVQISLSRPTKARACSVYSFRGGNHLAADNGVGLRGVLLRKGTRWLCLSRSCHAWTI